MFVGTINKLDVTRTVLVETHYLSRFDLEYLSNDCFSIVIIKNGSITLQINNTDCYILAPAVLCLDERKTISILSNNCFDVKIIKFDPRFLNVNMLISTIRSSHYEHLCQQHAFFQLSPFLTDDISKICIYLSKDALEKIEYSFNKLTKNLEEQTDWYWSCRARSYFIDIINILERLYHNFYIEEPYDACVKVAISSEFKMLLTYINTNLDKKQTLESLYSMFRINKNQIENLFHEFLKTTFYEYLRNRRYEEATYYLRFTELDGEQIATRIGLSSSQNFCKFFKQMSGTTPNKFRKEMVAKRKNDSELA
jgi:AraC family L-rhamnose operon regulatory protein RhaS